MQHNDLTLSKHANYRMRTRGISQRHVDFVLHYADRWEPAGRGAERVYLSSDACRRLAGRRDLGHNALEKARRVCVIVKDDLVITTMHRTRRFKR